MTNGNNIYNNYAKEAILPTVAILDAKNFKVKDDFLDFSQGTCRLKCNNNMQTMALITTCVSALKFEIEIPWSIFFLPLDSINKLSFYQIL